MEETAETTPVVEDVSSSSSTPSTVDQSLAVTVGNDKSGMDMTVLIGAIVGGIVVIVLIVLLIVCIKKKLNKK